jgi:pimeloyl-ACP methyl ester carboxylesterase
MNIVQRIPGFVLTDHTFTAPLDYANPAGPQIDIFAREVVAVGKQHTDQPWLLFLQGGPGGKSPRPLAGGGWIKRATQDYRVLLLDQRGTGRSTPATRQTLARLGSPNAQADYLAHFRADSIVRDAEYIRHALLGPDTPWSILGQSYGGFCALTYLSFAPQGLREAFITGGLAPLAGGPDDVYRLTYRRVLERNQRYFARYPLDQEKVQMIAQYLTDHVVRLPNGDLLTPQAFQALGGGLGTSDGFEPIHYLIDEAFAEGAQGLELSDTFLYGLVGDLSFAGRPLYAILHESIYCQGSGSHWSAERMRAENPEFNWSPGQPFLFTGEMIYPWMFETDGALQPLREAAELLAQRTDWPALYDLEQLRANTVPVAAAVYDEDMYVERAYSLQTARAVRGCQIWVTNEHQHNGLRADGDRVLGRLIGMVRGEV